MQDPLDVKDMTSIKNLYYLLHNIIMEQPYEPFYLAMQHPPHVSNRLDTLLYVQL